MAKMPCNELKTTLGKLVSARETLATKRIVADALRMTIMRPADHRISAH